MKATFIAVIWLSLGMLLFSSCEKNSQEDNTPPPLTAAGLSSGRAGIRFTTIETFKGSTSFDVSNTDHTSTVTKPAIGSTTIKSIVLEATEMKNSFLNRKTTISIAVPNTANTTNGTIQIDLSVQSGVPPLANITMESYADYLGFTYWTVTFGTLTITKLTAAEIEGTFSGTAITNSTLDGPFTISNGMFAGKF
jgi:hypothetical protein